MHKCGQGATTVVQMTPCPDPGWRVVFADHRGGPGSYTTEPVACWLLVNHAYGGDTHIHPAVVLGVVIEDATLAENYLGVVGPGQDPKTLATHASAA